MPSRVTVFACPAVALACACAVLSLVVVPRGVTAALPSPDTSATDLLGTDWWYGVDFTKRDKAPVTVTVSPGAVLYHCSDVPVDFTTNKGNYQGFWLTPDVAQAMAGGVNKAKEHHQPVFVHVYTPKRDLTLLALPACANAGIAYLNSVVATKGVQPWPHTLMGNPSQTNGLHPWLEKACAALNSMNIHGWRSPWDQDEVMLCIAHQTVLAEQQVRGCMYEFLGPNVPTRTYWNPVTHTPVRFESQVNAFPKDVCGTKADLFSYESPIRWAANLGDRPTHWKAWMITKFWDTLETKAAQLNPQERGVLTAQQYVKELVTRSRGKRIEADDLLWFCGDARQPH